MKPSLKNKFNGKLFYYFAQLQKCHKRLSQLFAWPSFGFENWRPVTQDS